MIPPLPFSPGAALLSSLWRMRGQDTPHLSDSGEEFDPEALVSFRASRDPRVYQNPKRSNRGERVKLHLLVDISSSMVDGSGTGRRYNAINLASMAALSAVMASVEVLPVLFGSGIRILPPCRSCQDAAALTNYLRATIWAGSTQTHQALAHAYQTAMEDPTAAHVVIVITDGAPDSMLAKESNRMQKRQDANGVWVVRSMVELMIEAGIEPFGFMVAEDQATIRRVEDCFGSDRYAVAANDHAAALALAAVVERFL